MKISVIVAAYNAKSTIEACIASVTAQTLSDFELLVVDDGSSDGTGEFLERLAQTDGRIRVFVQENRGPAAARSRALSHAAGQYVAFVDADDAMEPACLETLFEAAERTKADLAVCAHRRIKGDAALDYPMENGTFRISDRGLERFLLDKSTRLGHVIWGKLYRTACIRGNRVDFTDTRYSEDFIFNLCFYCYADTVVTLSDSLYCYTVSPRSMMANLPDDIVTKTLGVMEGYDAFLTSHDKRDAVGAYAHAVWLQKAYDLLNMRSRDGLRGIRACLAELDASGQLAVHITALKGKNLGKKTGLKLRLFTIRPKWLRTLLIWQCMKILLSKSLR